jgi:DNA-binding MarR family transcriptional regulator
MNTAPEKCAHEMLEVVPLVMRTIRTEMRGARVPGISVPQFRTLVYLNRHATASLSDVAAFLGLTLPSVSVLVDGLVSRDLVAREPDLMDRRRVTLRVTEAGRAAYHSAQQATEACLAERVADLGEAERAILLQALDILRPAFGAGGQKA